MAKDKEKYIFDDEEIERNCYILLACFFGSREFHAFCAAIPTLRIASVWLYERSQIKKLLINLAINLRMIDDSMRRHGRTQHIAKEDVGEIRLDRSKRPASIRDACNKIIHATSIAFHERRRGSITYLAPLVSLSGTERSVPWEAKIDIAAFVRAALFMAMVYEEDWDVSSN